MTDEERRVLADLLRAAENFALRTGGPYAAPITELIEEIEDGVAE